jgi:hypothetical protein
MSTLQTTVYFALWITLVSLGGLVVILYRQVDKAYLRSGAVATALPVGATAPELPVISEAGMQPLPFFAESQLGALAFLTTTCSGCHDTAKLLASGVLGDVPVAAVYSGEGSADFLEDQTDRFRKYWLTSDGDATERYNVSVVPTVYMLRGRTIVAASSDGSREGLEKLLHAASEGSEESALRSPVATPGGA